MEQRIPTITKVDDLEKLPMVQAGKDLWQNKWHRHDVYGHTVEVVRILKEELNASPGLIAAGWLHDIGKPKTKLAKMENGVPILHPTKKKPYHSFPEHEKRGEEMIKFELSEDKFRILGLDRDLVARIVGYHFKPMERIKKAKMNPTFEYFCEQVLGLASDLKATGLENEILTIFYADKASQQSKDLGFLLVLRDYLTGGCCDLQALYAKFKNAYS